MYVCRGLAASPHRPMPTTGAFSRLSGAVYPYDLWATHMKHGTRRYPPLCTVRLLPRAESERYNLCHDIATYEPLAIVMYEDDNFVRLQSIYFGDRQSDIPINLAGEKIVPISMEGWVQECEDAVAEVRRQFAQLDGHPTQGNEGSPAKCVERFNDAKLAVRTQDKMVADIQYRLLQPRDGKTKKERAELNWLEDKTLPAELKRLGPLLETWERSRGPAAFAVAHEELFEELYQHTGELSRAKEALRHVGIAIRHLKRMDQID